MASLLDKSVTKGDDGYDFVCPVNDGSCGADGKSFTSTGWPEKKHALARGQEHFNEHKGKGPATELAAFREKHGLVVKPDGKVTVISAKDL